MLAPVVLSVFCFVATARPEAARADTLSLELDPAHSTVAFTLGATLHTVKGTFAFKQGTIRFDPATGQASGTVVVDLTSGQSGDAKRDANMRNNVLQVQTYPLAVFTPSHVQVQLANGKPSALDVDGVLAIHGGSHAMTLHVTLAENGSSTTAHTQFSVPYVQWGMKDPSTFLLHVGNTVAIDVTAVVRENSPVP